MTKKRSRCAWCLPDALWERMQPLLPKYRQSPKGGRPRSPLRQIADGIFYVLRTGCQWKALPRGLGAASTVHDRFQEWQTAGVFEKLWQAGVLAFDEAEGIAGSLARLAFFALEVGEDHEFLHVAAGVVGLE